MTPTPPLDIATQQVLAEIEQFEAAGSVANTGTGARREGEQFEHLISELWRSFSEVAKTAGATATVVRNSQTRRYTKLTVGDRSLYVPASNDEVLTAAAALPSPWLELVFSVTDLVASFPSEPEAIRRYAPTEGLYAGQRYPEMYAGLSTKFDDTIVLEEAGVLREKVLLEYKTAKSTVGRQIDGNAHERLTFQVMQYLEIATRYTRCSLVVISNGAFARYRNKYHVSFHVQADRLSNFAWFRMEHVSTVAESERVLNGLLSWLFDGVPR